MGVVVAIDLAAGTEFPASHLHSKYKIFLFIHANELNAPRVITLRYPDPQGLNHLLSASLIGRRTML